MELCTKAPGGLRCTQAGRQPAGTGSAQILRSMSPNSRPGQMPFCQQEPVVPRMLHQAASGFHQPLLKTRERPTLESAAAAPVCARGCPDCRDVLQPSKSDKSAFGRVDPASSHAATSNSLWMN